MLKANLAGLVVAGFLLSTGVVNAEESAIPKTVDEAGIRLPSKSTYADRYRDELEQSTITATATESAIPDSVDEAGIRLPSKSTYADQYRGRITESMRAESNTSAIPVQNSTD